MAKLNNGHNIAKSIAAKLFANNSLKNNYEVNINKKTLLPFVKCNASGNDFILIKVNQHNRIDGTNIELDTNVVSAICNRHYGVGCDQLFGLVSTNGNKIQVVIYNQDGSVVANCGNGMRAVAGYFFKTNPLETSCEIEVLHKKTKKLIICKKINSTLVEVCMGNVTITKVQNMVMYNVGNLHNVIEIKNDKQQIVNKTQSQVATAEAYAKLIPVPVSAIPNKTYNSNYIHVLGSDLITLTTVERGVGVTNCCGSGSCASVAYCVNNGKIKFGKMVKVVTKGSIGAKNSEMFVIVKQTDNNEMEAKLIGDFKINFYGYLDNFLNTNLLK
ncbi:MAG: hypothetical protein JJW01_00730 [Alphaproteobacteria bacterium]|nr:hypothetical protein [Rickettsiales bacterium]